jgi:hypothetical protein
MVNKTHCPDQKKREGGPNQKFKFNYMLNKTLARSKNRMSVSLTHKFLTVER